MSEPEILMVGDRILLKPAPAEGKSPGGIVLPDNAKKRANIGRVLGVGPAAGTAAGERFFPTALKAGDVVMFESYSGTEVEIGGQTYKSLRESEIIAVIG